MSKSDVAVSVRGISKRYKIGLLHRQKSLRESVSDAVSHTLRRAHAQLKGDPVARDTSTDFWALRDVSFDVRRGDVLGIIGRNGAGKSTLLKILSRITEPTDGLVEMYGRVGSLLEVGTGFHPELTGRENIFLNGAVLGMTRAEVTKKFDAIVEFSEVEKFLDTPVKRYSSGMFVRLAFAVAAHLEPEILVIDEVLSVGDTAFQKKCLGKMSEVARQGRTVLFVSHNLGAVRTLCSRAVMLRKGRVYTDGTAAETVSAYLNLLEGTVSENIIDRSERSGAGEIQIKKIDIAAADLMPSSVLSTGQAARFIFYVSGVRPGIACAFTIYDHLGQPISHLRSPAQSARHLHASEDGPRFVCEIDELLLVPGRYRINVALWSGDELQDHLEGAAFFLVEQGSVGDRFDIADNGFGSVVFHNKWSLP